MKNKFPLWLIATPIIAFLVFLQMIYDLGERGELHSPFFRNQVYSATRSLNGEFTDLKFKLRGSAPAKNKIVIVSADEASVRQLGRWPWHREIYAQIIYAIFKKHAKNLALDVAFSEPQVSVPDEAYKLVGQKHPELVSSLRELEEDPVLAKIIQKFQTKLVLGFATETLCQPLYARIDHQEDQCPIQDEKLNAALESQLDPFALKTEYPFSKEKLWNTALINPIEVFSNIPVFRDAAKFAGSFFISPDSDGVVRRYPLFSFHKNKIYPSLALKLAELEREDQVKIEFSEKSGLIQKTYFSKDPDHPLPVSPLGNIDVNFRGARDSYPYISVLDLLRSLEVPSPEVDRLLDGASVFFGVTAIGLYDMRAFPFDSNTPGVEGHANALDNLISNDSLKSANNVGFGFLPILLMIILGFVFAVSFSKFEAVPSLAIFTLFIAGFGIIDIWVLFRNEINLPSVFLFIEILSIFVVTLAIRYILEERNKKFVREAFSKYLSPRVVDLVLEDPSKLTIGGERRELTVLFSDLRSFTSFSEKLDPKTLSQFLNEYLSEMTEIIFENEGTLDKYIGDAIMAFWGAPLHQDNHAELAWKTAVEMQKKLLEISPYFKEKYGVDTSAGIGLNSGEVSVGNMGSKRIFEYTVIGDHVNLASRLESLTRTYGCDTLTTEYTVNSLSDEFKKNAHFRQIDDVIVKGKTKSVSLIQILSSPLSVHDTEIFAEAKRLFKNRQWDEARALFLEITENDPIAKIFEERCEALKANPPDENWDGTIEMRRK